MSGDPASERERLDRIEDALTEALGEFEHELRRVGDAIVRAGRPTPELEARKAQLERNRVRTLRDLEKNAARIRALEEPPENGG